MELSTSSEVCCATLHETKHQQVQILQSGKSDDPA